MLAVIVGSLLALLLTYIIYTLLPANDDTDTSIDAFIRKSEGNEAPKVTQKRRDDHYRRVYDKPGRQLLILYGTEYGFSEEIAKKLFDRIDESVSKEDQLPWQPRIANVKQYKNIDFSHENLVFVVISTAGDGIPPTEARPFIDWVMEYTEDLSHVSYSVLALGDSNYPHFCRTGKIVDARMSEMGCHQLMPCHTVDMEDWEVINNWSEQVIGCLDTLHVEPCLDYLILGAEEEDTGPSRTRPFMSRLMLRRELTHAVCTEDEEKVTIHCEFDLTDSEITWTSGDALGIYPENNPSEVDVLIKCMGASGQEIVQLPKWAYHPKTDDMIDLQTALMKYYDLKTVKPELLLLLQKMANDTSYQQELNNLLSNGISKKNTFLHEYLHEREVADVLGDFAQMLSHLSVVDILAQMKGLQPRYYSIASSPLIACNCCWVTAAVVRYKTLGHSRIGVTTTYLQDRIAVGQSCPVFISHNPEFRLPSDGNAPIIMIGPGTGIAPFMAFISERIHAKANGRNQFYFGCRHKDGDFLYKEELECWALQGIIELRTAFSRDQSQKIYVQHLLREDANIIWELIKEQNAYIYVCGDAKHMAKDVHKELVAIMITKGNMTEANAENFMINLEVTGHYQKDVWVT